MEAVFFRSKFTVVLASTLVTLLALPVLAQVEPIVDESDTSGEIIPSILMLLNETEATTTETNDNSVNIDLFMLGSLVEEPTVEECTLSNSEESTCYRITVAGTPVDHDEGPYCPPYTDSTAEEGGIWFDGNNVYDVDGEFILNLATIYDDDKWQLYVDDQVSVASCLVEGGGLEGASGSCLECFSEDLENGQPTTTVLIPITPVAREEGQTGALGRDEVGVALNGVKLEGPAPVELILSGRSIGVFDDCAGHLNEPEGYHYHGGNGCSEIAADGDGHAAAFGYALDGYLIYSMLDSEGNEATDLDNCRGHTDDVRGYHYHTASVAENMFIGCFSGETVQEDRPVGPPT